MGLARVALASGGLAVAVALAGCNGKPEDTGQSAATADVSSPLVKTPAPRAPDWVAAMLGRKVTDVAKATTPCLGSLDVVGTRYAGPPQKADIEGWGWDQAGKRPIARVVFTDDDGKIVGGAVIDYLRKDVPAAVPEVKTPMVGWRGLAAASTGDITAVGLTPLGGYCTLGTTTL